MPKMDPKLKEMLELTPDAPLDFTILGTPIHDLSRSQLRKLLLNYETDLRAKVETLKVLQEEIVRPKIITP